MVWVSKVPSFGHSLCSQHSQSQIQTLCCGWTPKTQWIRLGWSQIQESLPGPSMRFHITASPRPYSDDLAYKLSPGSCLKNAWVLSCILKLWLTDLTEKNYINAKNNSFVHKTLRGINWKGCLSPTIDLRALSALDSATYNSAKSSTSQLRAVRITPQCSFVNCTWYKLIPII